ncbi:MAG: caspase family protein, partial [Cyanobacteriota bacterium]|nr:caspase family protein [Cyanobacteriota bacterium]
SAFPSDSLESRLTQVAGIVEQTMGVAQQPQLYRELPQNSQSQRADKSPTLKNLFSNSVAADGVITAVEDNGKTAKFLLTGLPISILESTQTNSLYTVAPNPEFQANPIPSQLLIRSRTGLTVKATVRSLGGANLILPELKVGQQLQEAIRVLPRQINLKVALDPKLARIERVDATSAFAGISDVSIVTNDQPADYILGRVRDTTIAQSPSAPLLSLFQGRYGLFSMGQALLPESVGEGGEAVKIAVQRLEPQFKTRLAAKLLNLTQNQQSPLMKAKATFALLTPQAKALISWKTPQGEPDKNSTSPELQDVSSTSTPSSSAKPSISRGIISVPEGSRVQYQLQNRGSLPLYFIWFHLDTRGQAYLLDPILEEVDMDEDPEKIPRQERVAPGRTRSLPPSPAFEGTGVSAEMMGQMVGGPAGLAQTYLVVSHYPFTETLKVIDKNSQRVRRNLKLIVLSNPLEIAEAVLEDLGKASQPGVERAGISTDDLALDISAWATFSFIYRVV